MTLSSYNSQRISTKTEMQKARDDVKAERLISYTDKKELFCNLGI